MSKSPSTLISQLIAIVWISVSLRQRLLAWADVDSWKLKKEKKIFDFVWSYKAVNWLSQIMRTGCILQFVS